MTPPDCDPSRAAFLFDRIAADLAELRKMHADLAGEGNLPNTPVRNVDLLDTNTLAQRLRLTRGQIVRLCEKGKRARISGIVRHGRPWFATVEAIQQAQALKGRR